MYCAHPHFLTQLTQRESLRMYVRVGTNISRRLMFKKTALADCEIHKNARRVQEVIQRGRRKSVSTAVSFRLAVMYLSCSEEVPTYYTVQDCLQYATSDLLTWGS